MRYNPNNMLVFRDAGLAYADTCIRCGDTAPMDAPFSGEWVNGLTGQDVFDMASIYATFDDLDEFEQSAILDEWEAGYLSADWPDWEDA